ncbi:MAG: two-component system, OmpR family, sensor histidine kinase ArlS [Acetobacterium sp.]|jgi:signal transduction histidine kinase|uniref:sensor histidine kinase n=1 Tax=Acetobacterium sp. K1/6 TaxID=3055467 RepID=UPI0029E25F0D|nr:HAMP domain-containing sensor histidine kinase [Acetobacterium sp. K1/6]MDK2940527.1 two-component system, OmpR family, sensor histidine kinase ArlS [Acetobacterium sp.]MDZ5724979.1 HAMP domain-containing sensor histidine kinase [Acetobacterium sp. K1/6]
MWFDKLNIPGRKKPLKIYHRIVFFFILALTVVLTLSFLMVFFFSQQIILNESQSTMIRFNNYVINTLDENMPALLSLPADARLGFISDKLYPYVKDNSLIAYQLKDNQGNSYQSSEILTDLLVAENLAEYDFDLFEFSFDDDNDQMIAVNSLRYNQIEYYYLGSYYVLEDGDIIYLQIIKNLNDSYVFMTILFVLMVSISILGLIAIILLGIYGTKQTLKPLIEISETAKNITENNLNIRIEETGNKDELDQLIVSLNQMIKKLESAFNNQKRFVSDASHELRIPLTVIQGYIDILSDWGKNDPQLRDESIEAIRDEIKGMNKMVEDLLLITRIENNYFGDDFVVLDISLLLEKIIYQCQMIDPDHEYLMESCDHAFVRGNEGLLIQAIRGLLDNSRKYTPVGGTISLSCRVCNKKINEITVTDTGCGIPSSELEKIKERFYRINSDRSRATGGSGLGLSIIDSIINVHRGKLVITSELGLGTKASIFLNKN